MKKILFLPLLLLLTSCVNNKAIESGQTDSTSPLHLMKPDYPINYGIPEKSEIVEQLDKIYNYLNSTTPMELMDRDSEVIVDDYSKIDENTVFKPGDFRLLSYEWGVTYAAMLYTSEITGDLKYEVYTKERLSFLSDIYPYFAALPFEIGGPKHAMTSLLHPHALDDCGALTAAMIKARKVGFESDNIESIIENSIEFISNKQFRLSDGTLARNRPMANSLWLDDLFMSVPALAQMGSYTGDNKYFEDAIKQVKQFSKRMFNYENNLFMHGWVEEMASHPQFHWARANGWAILTMVELLEVLPDSFSEKNEIVNLLKLHIDGLVKNQSSVGLWHQLIDKNDSYLETSATAIYVYSIAKAINLGYVDASSYGPAVLLGWNGVASKIKDNGQVEGTCVGTGMAFDPAFYYHRPVNVFAAHSYGPVIYAGAEVIKLLENSHPKMNDNAVIFYSEPIETTAPIFEIDDLNKNYDIF